jgi:hypothetical protein
MGLKLNKDPENQIEKWLKPFQKYRTIIAHDLNRGL